MSYAQGQYVGEAGLTSRLLILRTRSSLGDVTWDKGEALASVHQMFQKEINPLEWTCLIYF